MAIFNVLQCNIQLPTSPEVRCGLINKLWKCNLTIRSFAEDQPFDSFFEYYEEQCASALHDGRNRTLCQTHQDLIDVVEELRDNQATRGSIQTQLQSKLNTPHPADKEELLSDAVDLATRIFLMTSVGSFRNVAGPFQRTLQWKQDESLPDLLKREFSDQIQVTDNVKLERLFTARSIEKIVGIKIKWTSNLADHLRLLEDDTRVMIFHHASFLKAQESKYVQSFAPNMRIKRKSSAKNFIAPSSHQVSFKRHSEL
jgi:hypothetical protein